jgi:hypothetical protein
VKFLFANQFWTVATNPGRNLSKALRNVTAETPNQGCQMAYFQNKNPNLGKLWRVLQCKMLVHFMAIWIIFRQFGIFVTIWYILQPFGIFWDTLVYFVAIWYILWPFDIFYGYFVFIFLFWYSVPGKIWQPSAEPDSQVLKIKKCFHEKKSNHKKSFPRPDFFVSK